jgi:hypothetical protein
MLKPAPRRVELVLEGRRPGAAKPEKKRNQKRVQQARKRDAGRGADAIKGPDGWN